MLDLVEKGSSWEEIVEVIQLFQSNELSRIKKNDHRVLNLLL